MVFDYCTLNICRNRLLLVSNEMLNRESFVLGDFAL